MHRIIKRLGQQTRWQVYVRVLPVVFLAVLVVGAFGWVVFTRYATDRLIEHDREEVAFLMDNLRQKVLVKTMGLAARKADVEFEAASGAGSDPLASGWSADLLKDEYLVGSALVALEEVPGNHGADSGLQHLALTDSLDGPVNRSRLRTWFARNLKYMQQPGDAGISGTDPDPAAPLLVDDDPWHPTLAFPPILIEEATAGDQVSAGGQLASLLPVLVHEEEDGRELYHTLYFLSLDLMLADMMEDRSLISEADTWWCVVNYQGRVIAAVDNQPTVGSLLENQHRTHTAGPFSAVAGADLVGDWRLGQPWRQSIYGNRMSPWVLTAGQSPTMPLAIIVGHEARELGSTNMGYIIAVVGVALLALALAIFGVTRVVGRISDRVALLARNLEQVARGDYSPRMESGNRDEVDRLISYFNLMVVSLDETQRELTAKTRHLEVALENRRVLDRAKDDFLVLISHEVRTPLTAIMGGVNILRSLVDRTSGPEREVLDKLNLTEVVGIIESSGERLHGFMDDAIQMTSIQSSDQELDLQPIPVGSLIELGLCGVREMAQMRGIEIVNGLEREDHWQVLCDQKVLKLAFAKILKNAVEHNYDQGRVVIREVDEIPDPMPTEDVLRLRSLPSFLPFEDMHITWRLIEIFNTGEAIPAERCAALFGKFELVGRIEHHQRGSGLSLPIAQAAVENHGGRVSVQSVKLQGNSFYLLLPTVESADVARWSPALNTVLQSEQPGDRIDGGPGNENIGQVADPAGLEVEIND